jgi:hypothetical protein
MPLTEEDSGQSSAEDQEDEPLASVSLMPAEWSFVISCLARVAQERLSQTKECCAYAYKMQCKIVAGLAAQERNAPGAGQ